MNRLDYIPYSQTSPASTATGVWLSLSDGYTTVQRLGVIVPNVHDDTGTILAVVHYDGLQQPTNDEQKLQQYHSRTLWFESLTAKQFGGSDAWTIEGPLAVQPPVAAPVEDAPPEDLHEQYRNARPLPHDYRSFLHRYGSQYGTAFPPGGIIHEGQGREWTVPGRLKQVVVIDEEGARILPYALVPEGYVEVDLYSVFSKTGQDDPAPVEEDSKGLTPISMTAHEVAAMDFLLAGKRFAEIAERNGEDAPQFIGQTDVPVLGIDPASPQGDEAAYLLVRIRNGRLEYTNAPDDMIEAIDYNLNISTPSDGTDDPATR